MSAWDKLSMSEKADVMKLAIGGGVYNLDSIRSGYNKFAEGGDTEESHLSYGYPVYWSDEVPSRYKWAKEYLKNHPDVTGFAVGGGAQGPEDIGQRVIIRNSHSSILPDHNDDRWYSLDKIEAIRHYMNETGYVPNFEQSPEQKKFRRDNFSNEDHYGRNDTAWKQSIISRITADEETDKEFGVTPGQFKDYTNIMRGLNSKMDNHYNIPNEYRGGYYLPEVTISGNKHSIGGPLVESVMNEYKSGGSIHIKPSHRGRLTELKKRTGKTEAELYRTGGPSVRKMITFARNSRKWKHGLGGNLFDGTSQPTQQMFVREKNSNPIAFDTEGNLTDQITGDKGIMNLPEITIAPSRYRSAFEGNSDSAPELLRFTPVLGDALDAADIVKDTYNGNYINAALGAGLLTLPNFIEKPIKAIGKGAYKLLTTTTREGVERGRNQLLNWVKSPFYKERLLDEPLYRVADNIISDISTSVKKAPISIKERSSLEDFANGVTAPRPPKEYTLPDGTRVTDYNTGLDIAIASDLGKDADATALHELLHYMTANSKGTPTQKGTERIIENGWFAPTETHFDLIGKILKRRGEGWQNYIIDQNNSLLPEYDSVVKMVMEKPNEAKTLLIKAGRTPEQAEEGVKKLRNRYSYWYDIQEQRAHLLELFLHKIKPNLKNPNNAEEIEDFLAKHPDLLSNSSPYQYIQEIRPGSLKQYAKYFASALGTLPFIAKSENNE